MAAAGALPSLGIAAAKAERGPTLLTVTGAIAKPNRGSFDRAHKQWADLHREIGKPFVLVMLDVDNFKQINDTHGHPVGDRVLYCAAEWLR